MTLSDPLVIRVPSVWKVYPRSGGTGVTHRGESGELVMLSSQCMAGP